MNRILFLIFAAFSIESMLPAVHVQSAVRPCTAEDRITIPDIRLEVVAEGFTRAVHLTNAGDGSGRLFVVEQGGVIRIINRGKVLPVPFLDIRERVRSGGEMGLLSVAFHPRFYRNGRFFVNYTSETDGLHTVVSEFRVGTDKNMADKGSERIILKIPQPFSNHNGGQIAFGPDGYLYIGMGDGGGANDPYGNGQDFSTLLGAILRIDVDTAENGNRYRIPESNPFRNDPHARDEVWAYGLRNPWRFSFDPFNGILYAGDVGQDSREEVDIVKRGKNYGWNIMEGSICTPGVKRECNKMGLTLPILDYGRGDGISVIGGVTYRGSRMPELCGVYLYGDWGSGKIWGLRYRNDMVVSHKMLLDTGLPVTSFGLDENYEVYVVDYNGKVYKIKR